jgi:type VI secretion system secreted protein VgrG
MEIVTPLGGDLLFHRMTAREELGRLSEFEIDLLSDRNDIDPDKILGKNVTVNLELPQNKVRYFNGFVTRFAQPGTFGRYNQYHASVRPWLWFLTRTANCRIFQGMTVPDIVKKIFDDHSVTDVKFEVTGSYRTREYCVQYRETDFNFVSRLMEQEGIYYYFKHSEKRHTMVIADSNTAHSPSEGLAEIPYITIDRIRPEQQAISEWKFERGVKSGRYAIDDYYFEGPSVERMAKTKISRKHDLSDYEVYDYPGGYVSPSEGEHYVRVRLEELHARFELANGTANARGLTTGSVFNLTGHPRVDQASEYLVIGTDHYLEYSEYEAIGGGGADYHCSFLALNSQQPFRAQQTTPIPIVKGPQTAIVVGPGGDEIHTDKYGRVKVMFHWDREAKKDENSSCWIRVSHPWAGKNWGMVAIPRIGQEVIVDFLEGDPDRPIITGRVYNAEEMPPYALPGNMTQTGALTRSSKGGSAANANEFRFEDKKGSEQVYLHAEKNQDIEVEKDETHWVGHDRKKTIDNDETTHVKHDRTETVDHDEKITVHHDRTERVDNDETIGIGRDRTMVIERDKTERVARDKAITVDGNHKEQIGGSMYIDVDGSLTEGVTRNYAETVGIAMELTVGAGLAITVGAAMAETVGGAKTENIGITKTESIGGNKTVDVGGDLTENVEKNVTSTIGKDAKETIGGGHTVEITKEHRLSAKKIQLVGEDEINFKSGSAEIILKKNGDITIKGGKVNINASGDVVIKGSKILEN